MSHTFHEGNPIPQQYSCEGKNTNPPLTFIDVPENTKSLALIVEDPDAPNGTWTHWVLFNIPPATQTIDEGKIPDGAIQGFASSGSVGYEGPCPPSGTHRYFFKLYALDDTIPVEQPLEKAELEKRLQGHTLQEATLMGTYQKQ